MTRYLLLARHGAIDHDVQNLPINQPLKDEGKDVRMVASRLAEFIKLQPEKERVVIGEIRHGEHKAVCETANVIVRVLKSNGAVKYEEDLLRSEPRLNPEKFWNVDKNKRKESIRELLRDLNIGVAKPHQSEPVRRTSEEQLGGNSLNTEQWTPAANAILVVGHQPQVGWIAAEVLGKPIPIDRAELMCLALSQSWSIWTFLFGRWPVWTIAPTNMEAEQQLRQKIESKMQVAGILGGLVLAFLGLLLGALLDTEKISKLSNASQISIYLSTGLLMAGLALYIATVYAYDRLMMPVPFWGEEILPRSNGWLVQRPPSSASWVLYQNMIRIWRWMFSPATWFTIAGLLLLAQATFQLGLIWIVVAVVGGVVFVGYYFALRPTLGVED